MWGILFDVSNIHCALELNCALTIKMWGICLDAERVSCILTCKFGSEITGVGGKGITTAYHKSFGEDISRLDNEIERTRTLSGSDKEIVRDWTWGRQTHIVKWDSTYRSRGFRFTSGYSKGNTYWDRITIKDSTAIPQRQDNHRSTRSTRLKVKPYPWRRKSDNGTRLLRPYDLLGLNFY